MAGPDPREGRLEQAAYRVGMAIRTAVVPLAEIFPLRWQILRPGLPRESAHFAEDGQAGAFHIAAYGTLPLQAGPGERAEETVLGCGSFYPEAFPDPAGAPAGAAFRIRGMASSAHAREKGFGAAVLDAGTREARARGAVLLWCNGRTQARGFYERHGYVVRGAEFHIEGVGPHYLLSRDLR